MIYDVCIYIYVDRYRQTDGRADTDRQTDGRTERENEREREESERHRAQYSFCPKRAPVVMRDEAGGT